MQLYLSSNLIGTPHLNSGDPLRWEQNIASAQIRCVVSLDLFLLCNKTRPACLLPDGIVL